MAHDVCLIPVCTRTASAQNKGKGSAELEFYRWIASRVDVEVERVVALIYILSPATARASCSLNFHVIPEPLKNSSTSSSYIARIEHQTTISMTL